jgi:pSer/pThr/pTyr-binding forkhead associated (FHA) protein
MVPPAATAPPVAPPNAYLALLSAPGGNFPVGQERVTIGRAAGNQIILPADIPDVETVSRFHAAIDWQNGAHVIEDLDSQNGVLVNGRATAKNRLTDGDELLLGGVKMQYHQGEPAVQEGGNQS